MMLFNLVRWKSGSVSPGSFSPGTLRPLRGVTLVETPARHFFVCVDLFYFLTPQFFLHLALYPYFFVRSIASGGVPFSFASTLDLSGDFNPEVWAQRVVDLLRAGTPSTSQID